MYDDIPDVTRKRIVAMYLAGERLTNITDEFGLSRPTIYWILKSEGVLPSRKPRIDTLTMQELLEALRASEQEVGRLQAELDRLRNQ